jgi:hypothetical protein
MGSNTEQKGGLNMRILGRNFKEDKWDKVDSRMAQFLVLMLCGTFVPNIIGTAIELSEIQSLILWVASLIIFIPLAFWRILSLPKIEEYNTKPTVNDGKRQFNTCAMMAH